MYSRPYDGKRGEGEPFETIRITVIRWDGARETLKFSQDTSGSKSRKEAAELFERWHRGLHASLPH